MLWTMVVCCGSILNTNRASSSLNSGECLGEVVNFMVDILSIFSIENKHAFSRRARPTKSKMSSAHFFQHQKLIPIVFCVITNNGSKHKVESHARGVKTLIMKCVLQAL